MSKTRTTYYCQNCGAKSSKWIGKCPSCNEWNTYAEEIIEKVSKAEPGIIPKKAAKPMTIDQIKTQEHQRIALADGELNRVLGGGLVAGSVILLGGEPGIGKSTLSLQIATGFEGNVLYVSGEESAEQIGLRAERLALRKDRCHILSETSTTTILHNALELNPELIIIDSIQTMHSALMESAPGSVGQIRQSAAELIQFSKNSNTPIILIGHITKDGSLAGPKVLEHMVDVVLQFEGDRNHLFRLLRSLKNRFGSTHELGIYEMRNEGLKGVVNPSQMLLSNRDEDLSGVAIAASIEGIRPLMIETQALVSTAAYGTPQRSGTGFDLRRLNMLLAVLEKRCGFKLASKDVFLNIAGGIRVEDPAIDLAVVMAILSSNMDISVSPKLCFAGEIGLSGELRPISKIEQRIKEAEKLGFEQIVISSYNLKGLKTTNFNIQIRDFKRIDQVFKEIFVSG